MDFRTIKEARWLARRDLGFLCRELLGFKDVDDTVHGGLMASLQKFPAPATLDEWEDHDKYVKGKWSYSPLIPNMLDLPGSRRCLILDSRGHLKSTINVVAHTIQWIINYPDIAVAVIQSTGEKAETVVEEIKNKFKFQPQFREIFPEHCPQRRINDWGAKGEFFTCARTPFAQHKEKTVSSIGVETGVAGLHFDLMKFSDIVEQKNAGSSAQCRAVTNNFDLMHSLLVSPVYWIDVEGTRYHFADTYGRILEREWTNKPPEKRTWKFYVRGCYKTTRPDGKPQQFTPDELDYPDELDANGNPIPWWPKDAKGAPRFPLEYLQAEEAANPGIFACQKRNRPSAGGMTYFRVDDSMPLKIRREDFNRNVRVSHFDITIDTAHTINDDSHYSAIAAAAWSTSGKCYIDRIVHGRFLPDMLARKIIATAVAYSKMVNSMGDTGRLASVKIEKTTFVDGLMPTIQRYMETTGLWLPIEVIPRNTHEGKIERIAKALQPWYSAGNIIFVDDLGISDPEERDRLWNHLLKEMREFPLSETLDILDALSDLFQNKPTFGREDSGVSVSQERDLLSQLIFHQENPWDPRNEVLRQHLGATPAKSRFNDRTGGL